MYTHKMLIPLQHTRTWLLQPGSDISYILGSKSFDFFIITKTRKFLYLYKNHMAPPLVSIGERNHSAPPITQASSVMNSQIIIPSRTLLHQSCSQLIQRRSSSPPPKSLTFINGTHDHNLNRQVVVENPSCQLSPIRKLLSRTIKLSVTLTLQYVFLGY